MPNLLDVDSSVLSNRLLFKDLDIVPGSDEISTDSIDSLLGAKPNSSEDVPWKAVRPNPGYCVKLKSLEGDKVFVNICQTEEVPEPPDVSEKKLIEMLTSDEHTSSPSFLIPMSIGNLHVESDKSRNPCSVYDIAINSNFFKKIMTSEVFNTYFLNASIQALNNKYSLNLDVLSDQPFILLKNRKVFGTLQVHRVEKREPRKPPTPLIQEIDWKPDSGKKLSLEENKSLNKCIEKRNTYESVNDRVSSSKSVEQEKNSSSSIPECAPIKSLHINDGIRIEDSEKGMKECRVSKEHKTEKNIENSLISPRDYLDEKVEPHVDSTLTNKRSVEDRRKLEETMCPGVLCIRQYPESGDPQLLILSVRLNVNSSRDFNLELDNNRICISVIGRSKPYYDISLPYTIDDSRVEARFIVQHKKLVVKMDVVKS